MNVKKLRFLNFPLGMKKLVIFGIIVIFLLSGCEQIKELYGIEPSGEEEYVPIEEIKIEEEEIELPPSPPEEEIPEIEEIVEEIIEEIEEEEIPEIEEIIEEVEEEMPEELVEIPEEEVPEEVVEEKEEAKVLIVKETELVSLKPKATDPDGDILTFTYTTPLDEKGKWQTTYGDAGEYTVTITASDGELSTAKDILIIVNKKEEAPVIEEAIPEEETLKAKEDSKLEFSVKGADLNNDPLTYLWKLDGDEVSAEKSYTYNIGYDDAGQHTVKVLVSDGVKEASKIWALTVENVNRKPVLEKIADIKVGENEVIVLEPKATDPDNDELIFSIDSDKFKQIEGRFEWQTTYDDSGGYTVKVTVSDGIDEVSQEVEITVENVNRPPVFEEDIFE